MRTEAVSVALVNTLGVIHSLVTEDIGNLKDPSKTA